MNKRPTAANHDMLKQNRNSSAGYLKKILTGTSVSHHQAIEHVNWYVGIPATADKKDDDFRNILDTQLSYLQHNYNRKRSSI